jgi:hypothetical protein
LFAATSASPKLRASRLNQVLEFSAHSKRWA